MVTRTIPFDYSFFYNAMIALLGREPDRQIRHGFDGFYSFRYDPKDRAEADRFAKSVSDLQRWLSHFELLPFRSKCEFGRLPQPLPDEEGKDYLFIDIVHSVEAKET